MSLDTLLKSFSEEDKAPDELSLAGFLQRGRLKKTKVKKAKPREMALSFSPYNLGYGFCMREKVAHLAGLTSLIYDVPTPSEQIVFDVGHKYHDMIQGYFWDIGSLEGWFECLKCDNEWWDIAPKNCPKCKAWRKYLTYREIPLVSEDWLLKGRADGIVNVLWDEQERKDFIDIKSISNKPHNHYPNDPKVYFEDLEEPMHNHIVQLQCYMMMNQGQYPNAHLFYVAKNTQKIKSFHIKYDPEVLKPYLDIMQNAIEWAEKLKNKQIDELPSPCSAKKCECEKIIIKRGEKND